MTSFSALSLKTWISRKDKFFQQALAQRKLNENWIKPLSLDQETALDHLLEACTSEKASRALMDSLGAQGEILAVMASLPLDVRMRFFELLALHSCEVVRTLMDETLERKKASQEATFIYQSVKQLYALKILLEMFDPQKLALRLLQPPRGSHEVES